MNEFLTPVISALSNFFGGITSNFSIDLAFKIAIAYGLVIWFATVIWVIKDITNRSTSILVHVFSILLIIGLTPIFGLPIYLLIRPNTTLFEQYYEESSLDAIATQPDGEEELSAMTDEMQCPYCHGEIDKNHHYCPHCGKELLVKCVSCNTSIHGSWKFCPNCGSSQIKSEEKPEKKEKKKKAENVEEVAEKISLAAEEATKVEESSKTA